MLPTYYRIRPASILQAVLLALALVLAAMLFSGCAWLKPITPAPVAAGQDSVVVNIERVQASSLEFYKQCTEWEYANRNALSPEVSQAVDKVRLEFPKAWEESRRVLADYKLGKVSGNDVDKVTAALSAAQSSMIRLKVDNAEAFQLVNSIATLTQLINSLRK